MILISKFLKQSKITKYKIKIKIISIVVIISIQPFPILIYLSAIIVI
jgi:hypothetical protein